MKIVYHKRYCEVYASDPAAAPGRIESIVKELKGKFEFVTPQPANEEDLRLVHTQNHIEHVKRNAPLAFEIGLLAVGGAIKASEIAMNKEPAFALIRPPGHHASPDSSWGFCYFNNVAIAIEKLRRNGKIEKAVIVDIDLHFGDGTANIFSGNPNVIYHHVADNSREKFINDLKIFLDSVKKCDIVAVSAGFDRHEMDWGGILKTEDYRLAGKLVKEFAEKLCRGRRFAVLEGGYNHAVLGLNVKSFIEGFM